MDNLSPSNPTSEMAPENHPGTTTRGDDTSATTPSDVGGSGGFSNTLSQFMKRKKPETFITSTDEQPLDDIETGASTDVMLVDLPSKIVEEPTARNKTGNHDDNGSVTSASSSNGSTGRRQRRASNTNLQIAMLILLVGAGAAAIILGAGISAANKDQQRQFDRLSGELTKQFETTVAEYMTAGLWTHQAIFRNRDVMTPRDFRIAYEYLLSTGLELQAASWIARVDGEEEREFVENRTRQFLQEEYPEITYRGFTGFNIPGEPPGPRDVADVYYPVLAVEPFDDPKNRAALSFDVLTSGVRRAAVQEAVRTYKPALTERLKLIQESYEGTEQYAYSTILWHPGIPLSASVPPDAYEASQEPRDMSVIVVRIPDTLVRTRQQFAMEEDHQVSLYIYDSTNSGDTMNEEDKPPFLGGALFLSNTQVQESDEWVQFYSEVDLCDVKEQPHRFIHERRVPIANREWTFVVVAHEDDFQADVIFVAFGATMVLVACMALAAWVVTSHRKMAAMNRLKARADAEKADLMVTNAREAAQKERELNDFLSHEVRNPISAAISACSFVHSAIQDHTHDETGDLLVNSEDRTMIVEDVAIIESSLQFVNDLLRNMLDMHRAASNQMKIVFEPVDLLHDVLEPVAAMLYQRGSDFQVLLDCPEKLVVLTDKLRLKQTCLNLGRNAVKFVETGFVRLRAAIVDGRVEVYIEDSGSGIPVEKRKQLFGKFQEALDTMSQGTGMGLSLCKSLVELMHGELWLDEEYHSGIEGNPGARFVIDLKKPPIDLNSAPAGINLRNSLVEVQGQNVSVLDISMGASENTVTVDGRKLPENLSVLFVDDDWKLRTLFTQALSRTTKGWTIREASSGETALRLCEEDEFSIIFMDQYMSSVVKQLLGTETVKALRARGVTSAICGLSDNDNVEKPFLQAGANVFFQKPLPTDRKELAELLFRILDSTKNMEQNCRRRQSLERNPLPRNSAFSTSSRSMTSTATNDTSLSSKASSLMKVLPKTLSVLVVDDDNHLRQLWSRSLKRVGPLWTITNVASGEEALEISDTQEFDLIFLDQYMPNPRVEKPMLGTETAAALRAKGVTSLVCGLSANDKRDDFLAAGADFFHIKPFPVEREELATELVKILGIVDESIETEVAAPVPAPEPSSSYPPNSDEKKTERPSGDTTTASDTAGLRENLRVLYADDSPSLRKMFSRSIQRATKGWTIHPVECGEDALEAVDSTDFDLIFLDQHMSTAMLGTDTATALREKGVKSIICGLSGDDIEAKFVDAGANCFMMKPFPCEKNQLAAELDRILKSPSVSWRF